MRLDARARLAALAVLDPREDGSIDEGAFIAWWEEQQPAAHGRYESI